MKFQLITPALLFLTSFSAFAGSEASNFLVTGKTYNIEYLLDLKTVSESNLPRFVKIIEHGPDEWYYVQRSENKESRLWINFSEVLSVQEASEQQGNPPVIERRIIRSK
jgi:hypothetical protein